MTVQAALRSGIDLLRVRMDKAGRTIGRNAR